MFTTLHFWAGFAIGAVSIVLTIVGGLFLLSYIASAGSPSLDEDDGQGDAD